MSSFTWRDFIGPVCIFVDGRWQNGKVVEIRADEVVYKLSGDPDSFIITKDEAHSIIRKRGTVALVGKGKQYTGRNPLVFGPKDATFTEFQSFIWNNIIPNYWVVTGLPAS